MELSIRGILRGFGLKIGLVTRKGFEARVRCDAYASWQKGGVENANGRLRRWLPRQIDIDQMSDEEIQDIVMLPISRPENAWASRPLSRRSSNSLAKTCKSGSLSLLHLDLESRPAGSIRQFADRSSSHRHHSAGNPVASQPALRISMPI